MYCLPKSREASVDNNDYLYLAHCVVYSRCVVSTCTGPQLLTSQYYLSEGLCDLLVTRYSKSEGSESE